MLKYTGRGRVAGALCAAFLLAACSSGKKDSLAQDSTLALANAADTTPPQLRDVPGTTTPAPAAAPAAAAPRVTTTRTPARVVPRPSAPARTTTPSGNTVTRGRVSGGGAVGTIAAGTALSLASSSRVCTNTNKVGDVVYATVQTPVTGSNGVTIPAGARVALTITQLKRSENANQKIQMGFRVESVSFGGNTYPVSASVTYAQVDRVRNEPQSKDVQKVATGAAVGAVLGRILGKSTKSTVIGGAVGAAAGAGAAATTANYEGCVPAGGRITARLDNSVQIRA